MESISPSSSAGPNIAQRVPWHSPLPYLFGGLAAMLSLISFALVILACSYWNISRRNRDDNNRADLESAAAKTDSTAAAEKINYDEKVLVIMAGNQNPTFIATPVCVKITSSSAVETAASGRSEEKESAEKSKKLFDREEIPAALHESSGEEQQN